MDYRDYIRRGLSQQSSDSLLIVQLRMQTNRNPSRLNCKLHYYGDDNYTVFLYYNYSHLLNKKDRFTLGQVRVFTDTSIYTNQLVSTSHLNAQLDWGQAFFDSLIESFPHFRVAESRDQDDRTLHLLVDRQTKNGYQNLLKVALTEEYGKDVHKEFWKEFQAYNIAKNQQIKSQQESNERIRQRRDQNMQELKQFQQNCEDQKKVLLGHLSALLREKVAKLREDFGDNYEIPNGEDRNQELQGTQPRIMSTYQEEKQFMGSLFQPSQDFYR